MFTVQSATSTFLANLSALENRLSTTNRQVSSGLQVQTVSDAPNLVPEILQLNASIAKNDQIGNNLGQAQTEVAAAEGAISTATTLMDQATQIGAEGSSGTNIDRGQLANQVGDILKQMQQIASSQVSGRYVFSGNSDQTAPYGPVNFGANTTNGLGNYLGSNSTRSIEDPSGATFSLGFTAQQIFDGGTGGTAATSVIQALTQLHTALVNNDQSAAGNAVANIRSAANYLSGIQAQYGDIQTKISNAQTTQQSMNTNFQTQLSGLQDVDEAQAITQQQTDSTALTAAETAYASLPKKSLFDFLG